MSAEANFYHRTVNMLKSIQHFEQANLRTNMQNIAHGALETVLAKVEDPATAGDIKRASFESALNGIREGRMTYQGDAILPLIQEEMAERLEKFKGLTVEEEQTLLALTDEQKAVIAQADRGIKNEFLQTPPQISHGSVKAHDKFKSYMKAVHIATQ